MSKSKTAQLDRISPDTWPITTLGEIGTWVGGGTPSKAESKFWINGSIPWISPKDMKVATLEYGADFITEQALNASPAKLVPSNSILIVVRSGILAHTVPVAINLNPVTVNQDLKCLIPSDNWEPKFILYYLMCSADSILKDCSKSGTTVASIDFNRLKRFPIPQPTLDQQREIVSKLELLLNNHNGARHDLNRASELLLRYKRAIVKASVQGRLTADWRSSTTPTNADETRTKRESTDKAAAQRASRTNNMQPLSDAEVALLPDLPMGWKWVRVCDAGHVQLGRQRAPKHHTGSHMRPYLRVANVYEDRIDTSDVLQMNFTPQEFETYALKTGDILLNEGQSLELIGRPAIYRDELPGSCFQNTLVRFRPRDFVLSEYAQSVFLSYFYDGTFQSIAKWTTNIAHLGAERFAALPFPLPPVDEQSIIVDKLASIKSCLLSVNEHIDRSANLAQHLRSSILKGAFKVPQKELEANRLMS